MKTMTKTRFFENDIKCATVIDIEKRRVLMQEAMFEDKSGFCFGIEIYKNADIIDIIKENSIHEEQPGVRAEPKIEITTEPIYPPVDMFEHYTASLEMTVQEFAVFRNIARDGKYLIAFTD